MPADSRKECLDPKFRSLPFIRFRAPFVVIEYDDATSLHQWPRQSRVVVDIGRYVATVDIGEIEPASRNTKFRQDGCRGPLDFLDTVHELCEIAIEFPL